MIKTFSKLLLVALVLATAQPGCKPRRDHDSSSDVLAYSQAEVSSKFGVKLIPEVVRMPSGSPIPASILDNYDDRTIAESMIFRLHANYDDIRPGYRIGNQRWLDESILGMRFPDNLIDKIAAAGFLNQHQTKTTGGSTRLDLRLKCEQVLLDLALESTTGAGKLILPKYSWLSLNNDVALGEKYNDAAQYGNWIAVFRKEVKLRSTLTYDDSLNKVVDGSFRHDNRRTYQSTFYTTDAYAIKGAYLEAQIWGSVDFSDVERFLIDQSSAPASLTRYGIPVSTYSVQKDADRYNIVIGRTLYAGDPAKLAQYRLKRWGARHFNGEPGQVPLDTRPEGLDTQPEEAKKAPAEELKAPLAKADIQSRKYAGTSPEGQAWQVEIQDTIIAKTTIDGVAQSGPWKVNNKLPSCVGLMLDKKTKTQWFHVITTDKLCFAGTAATCEEAAATNCIEPATAAVVPPTIAGPEKPLEQADLYTPVPKFYYGRGPDGQSRKVEFRDANTALYSGATNEFPGSWVFTSGEPKCVQIRLNDGRKFWYWFKTKENMCFGGTGTSCDSSSDASCMERR